VSAEVRVSGFAAMPVSFLRMPSGDLENLTADAVGQPPARASGVVERPRRGPWLDLWPPHDVEWNIARLQVPGLPAAMEGIRIAHITDLHVRPAWRSGYDRLLEQLKRERPDLLLVTGDFVDNKQDHRPTLPFLYRLLEGFTARLGCFGILGNHDTYALAPRLQGTNVRLITGKRELVPVDGATIELIGLEGVKRKELTQRFVDSLPPREKNSVRIVLSHFPDHLKKTKSLRPDLFLAGHTHGGQVCLPGGFPILRHDTLPRRLCTGVHKVDGTWLIVTRGIGATGLPIRAFCPPEVMEIRLTSVVNGPLSK
jgi:predicted MPP superfamily phosphohydrolase